MHCGKSAGCISIYWKKDVCIRTPDLDLVNIVDITFFDLSKFETKAIVCHTQNEDSELGAGQDKHLLERNKAGSCPPMKSELACVIWQALLSMVKIGIMPVQTEYKLHSAVMSGICDRGDVL